MRRPAPWHSDWRIAIHRKSIKVSDEEFAATFPYHTDAELAELWQTTRATVQCKARRMGLRKSPEHMQHARKLIYDAIRGEQHYGWKGGITARLRQGDPRYSPWRDAVLKRDNYTCQQCGGRRRRSEMHAHHIKPYAEYVELRHDIDNGLTLCILCHNALHGQQTRPRIQIPCKCGCGTLIDNIDKWGYAREWVNGGHATRGRTITPEQRAAIAKGGIKRKGYKHTEEARAKIATAKTGHVLTEAEKAGNERRKARWSNKYDCCVLCGRSDTQHYGKGRCLHCYVRERTLRHNPQAGTGKPRHKP